MVILLGVYSTTESLTDSVSLILGTSPVGMLYFYLHFAYGKTEAQRVSACASVCPWADSTACPKHQDLCLKTLHTVQQPTVIFLICLSAGTEMAPGGLQHHSNFTFKCLKEKKKSYK